MERSELISLTVTVANRPYPLKVQPSDESTIRLIVKELNDKVNQFQQQYPHRDKQDILSMTLLTYAFDLHKAQSLATEPVEAIAPTPTTVNSEASDRLDELDRLLDRLSGS